jgi:hypothetical protein
MEMSSKKSSSKWLVGLGIGCGGAVVIAVVLVIAGYFFVRNMAQGFRDSQELMKSLTAKYGRAEDYCPDPDGSIPAARLEVFLSARDAMGPARKRLAASFEEVVKLEDAQGRPSRNAFSAIRTGMGVVTPIAGFFKARAEALLDREMGPGEYSYVYMIAYYSWLKKPATDGAGMEIMTERYGRDNRDRQEALEVSRDVTLRRINRLALPMLENQLARRRAVADGGGGKAADKWAEALAGEIKALAADRLRIPWQDGVPEVIDASLRPFRERLEAGYVPVVNVFELVFDRR